MLLAFVYPYGGKLWGRMEIGLSSGSPCGVVAISRWRRSFLQYLHSPFLQFLPTRAYQVTHIRYIPVYHIPYPTLIYQALS